jgi:NADP-dependent 3-hydroxy acid dehydrogenase YdfG
VKEIGGDDRLLVLDVTDAASITDAACQVDTLDILVNNAGISGDNKTAEQEDLGTFRHLYETNILGAAAVTNAFLPALRRSTCRAGIAVAHGRRIIPFALSSGRLR